MNILKYLSILLIFTFITCKGQYKQQENYLQFDIWPYINSKYIRIFSTDHRYNDREFEMISPYYELDVHRVKFGNTCLFAISKTYPEDWIKKDLQGECREKSTSSRAAVLCNAKKLFSSDTTLLKDQLDLYLFVIEKKELDGPFIEEVEDGIVRNYYPQKGSTVIIYKYINDQWKEFNRVKQEGNQSPKSFGMTYIEQLASEKVEKYLKSN